MLGDTGEQMLGAGIAERADLAEARNILGKLIPGFPKPSDDIVI